jgi:hypothetical protein
MRYRIEYLIESTEEQSVCETAAVDGDLETVERLAKAGAAMARIAYGAGGFQIRDLEREGRVITIETFDDASGWLGAGHHVVH